MNPAIGAGLITGGANLLGSVAGWFSNRSTNNANMELAKYQYQKNLEMWNRQNEYNKPINQMKRLQEAGLNPNLIYGNGTTSTGNSSSMPEYKSPELNAYTDFGDFGASSAVQAYNAARQTDSNIKLAQSQSDLNEAKKDNEEREGNLKHIKYLQEILKYNQDKESFPILLQQYRANVHKTWSETGLNEQRSGTEMAKREQIQVEINHTRKNIDRMESDMSLDKYRAQHMIASSNLAYKQAEEAVARTKGIEFMNQINEEQRVYISLSIREAALKLEQERIRLGKDNTWYQAKLEMEAARIFSSVLGVVVSALK